MYATSITERQFSETMDITTKGRPGGLHFEQKAAADISRADVFAGTFQRQTNYRPPAYLKNDIT